MITIYKRKEDIPESRKLIEMNDVYFNRVTSQILDKRASDIVKIIDGAVLHDKYKIVSKFQKELINIDKLSTGCKTALNIYYFPKEIFSVQECGDNALDLIYMFPEGQIFSPYPVISMEMERVKTVERQKTQIFDSYEQLKEWWENV